MSNTAGDTEVQRYDMSGYGSGMIKADEGAFVYFDDHRSHVTRLTAELTKANTFIKVLREQNEEFGQLIELQQSERAKAQEAMTKIAMWPDGGNAYGQDKIKAFANRILSGTELHKATEIAHQSAPACCTPSAVDLALLAGGDYCAEELWGGPHPTCPKCIGNHKRW